MFITQITLLYGPRTERRWDVKRKTGFLLGALRREIVATNGSLHPISKTEIDTSSCDLNTEAFLNSKLIRTKTICSHHYRRL